MCRLVVWSCAAYRETRTAAPLGELSSRLNGSETRLESPGASHSATTVTPVRLLCSDGHARPWINFAQTPECESGKL
jgi:hypothetical protein